jgi:hypothetical protein
VYCSKDGPPVGSGGAEHVNISYLGGLGIEDRRAVVLFLTCIFSPAGIPACIVSELPSDIQKTGREKESDTRKLCFICL